MRVPFHLLDVFAPRPLAGNQLCVVSEPLGLGTETMQALAREIGFSETTFVTEAGGDRYAMRIFTPAYELPFAGHPSLGTCFVLLREGRIVTPATQVVAAGEFHVHADLDAGTAWVTQLPAVFGEPYLDRALLADAIGLEVAELHADLPVRSVSAGLRFLMVPTRDREALRAAERRGRPLAEVCRATETEGLYLFAVTEEGIAARMLDRDAEIGEDPATGSAAGPLGAYLAQYGLAGVPERPALIRQGEQVGRPSELHVEVTAEEGTWRPRVGGGVHVAGTGEFTL